jgi:hypothetical protein
MFCLLLFQLFSAEHKVNNTEEKYYFGFDSGKKCESKIEWGGFFMTSISKIMVQL